MSQTDLAAAAQNVLGLSDLREGQRAAMEATMEGRDVLAVMPTGYGKSALYQVPAALLPGVTIVVSPLLALQRDQVAGLRDAPNAPPADAVNSNTGAKKAKAIWAAASRDEHHILFLAPEQFTNDEVMERLGELDVAQFVVDEAHCISAWGHDFRPDYLQVGAAVERLGHPRVVALTATASPPVRDEIADRLHLRDPLVVVQGFDRPNLHLTVHRHVEDDARRDAVVVCVAQLARPGLLYVATRKDAEEYADRLGEHGMVARAYHGGMRAPERREVHRRFTEGSADVVVATSAFGMGIDKADIRFVVHAAAPESPDTYYQEIGRAGRDGEPAEALLFYRPEDLGLHRFHSGGSPDEDALRMVFAAIRHAGSGVRMTDLRRDLDIPARRVTGLVNLLEQAGAVRVRRSRVSARDVRPDDAVRQAVEAAESRQRVERSRIEMMRGYAETTGCRRQFLLGYLGEQLPEPCGNCDTCEAGSAYEHVERRGKDPFPVGAQVAHAEWGPGVVMSTEEDRLTVLFESEGYRTLALEAVQEDDLLELAD
ncbi:MAG: RecQ family ATP-dependent DNA helicase [Intrasporangium sp.]|uniref:RecQ family ATP-dependent DNA helicase n=1 Tax=Intrasporangium sp. TaxID=1925024 RepID=UPI003F7D2E76